MTDAGLSATAVLDASAVLADLRNEPGAEAVRAILPGSVISSVNFAEVITKLIEYGVPALEAQVLADNAIYRIVDADRARAASAGVMHERTRRTGVSLGDRFCLALALETGAPTVTGDRRWKDLDLGVEIVLIR